MSKRSPIITAGIALLVALTLSVSVAQPAFALCYQERPSRLLGQERSLDGGDLP